MKDRILEWIGNNKGAAVGILVGLVLAILIFTINFWRTLLLIILVAAGYYIGHAGDRGQSILGRFASWIDGLFNKR